MLQKKGKTYFILLAKFLVAIINRYLHVFIIKIVKYFTNNKIQNKRNLPFFILKK